MPSIQATLINWILPLRGSRKRMSDAGRMAAHYATNVPVAVPPPPALTREFTIVRKSLDGMPYWRVTPATPSGISLLYIHGGAYVNELVGPHWSIIAGLVRRTGATVDVPLYALAPRHSWADTFPPLLALARGIGAECPGGNFCIAGDSSGAGLALALCQGLRDASETMPHRLVLLSPFLDARINQPEQQDLALKDRMLAAPGLRWAAERWANGLSVDDPRVSPLNGTLAGLPPILVMTGTSDLLHSDAKRLRDKARSCYAPLTYVEYQDMFHVWMGAPIPEADAALDEVGAFLSA